jgi:hypothetical protein
LIFSFGWSGRDVKCSLQSAGFVKDTFLIEINGLFIQFYLNPLINR